jgi:putative glutamine amidotransferase
MNVALGGTLFQDLLSERATSFDHETKDNCWESSPHRVSVAEGSILSRTTQLSNFPVNSIHHQAIKALAPDLAVAARSEIDGIIEAVEIPGDEFSMAVQWHPEIFTSRTGTQESLVSLAIFGAFIEGARRSALRR